MKHFGYLIAAILLLCAAASAQVSITGDLNYHIDSVISTVPDESTPNLYGVPSAGQSNLWRQIVQDLLDGSYSSAHSAAGTIGYRVVEFHDNAASPARLYYVLEKLSTGSNYWGTYVFNPSPKRPNMLILCPHPIDNRNTGEQGWRVFKTTQALVWGVAGTSKCNSTSYSPCDGSSTSCSPTSEPYRLCDQAHVINGTFQMTTEELLAEIPDLICIQPHGYTPGTGDPDIVLSNGTTYTPSGDDICLTLRDNLLGQDPTLTFKIPHIDVGWTEMSGRTNVQGRLMNNAASPCTDYASAASNQFFHFEQTYYGLRDTEANWHKLANAVALTFPAVGEIATAQSGSWTDPATWVGGLVPGAADDVLIIAGHLITVDDGDAECHSVAFGGDDAQIDMNANSMLTVYGDFTLYSTTHNVFSAGWSSSSAYLKFAGTEVQTIGNFNLSEGSTSFRDVIVDKATGKVTTDGLGMVLGIQNSLHILNGTFELAPGDDLEARWASSAARTQNQDLTITVEADGHFILAEGDGFHFIRSGEGSMPIGPMTLHGEAQFYDGSSLDISINNISVLNGGQLEIGTGLYSDSTGAQFNPGTVTVESGGEIYNTTVSDVWFDTSVVILNAGATFATVSETTVIPPNFTNNGRFRYQRDPTTVFTDQVIVDTNYYDIEFAFNGNSTKKLWSLTNDRNVADSFIVGNLADVIITADNPQTLTIQNTLRLTSGTLDISDADVDFEIADGGLISRATGTISDAPSFAGKVNLRYTSSLEPVTTGPELPTSTSAIGHLTIIADGQTVTLANDATVNDTLTLSQGTLDNSSVDLALVDGAWLRRATGGLSSAPSLGSTVNVEYISTVSAVTTAAELPTSTTTLNDLKITSTRGVTLSQDVTVNGALTVTGSNLITDGYQVTLGSSATLSESSSFGVRGTAITTRTASLGVNETFGGIGVEINAAGATPGSTTISRVTGTTPTIPSVYALARSYDISPTTNSGLNATFVFHYAESELSGLDETGLSLYSSNDGGTSWTPRGGVVDVNANTITLTGVNDFSLWSAGGSLLDVIISAQSGSWGSSSTWNGGIVPSSTDDVIILSGHTVVVDDQVSECQSLAFGGEDAHIQMADNSRLDIYGDFTLFDRTHNVFQPGWSENSAYIRFTGDAVTQTIGGFSTTGGSTSFRDVIIEKSSGIVRTEGGGDADGMRLCLQNGLEIISGTFIQAAGDDIEARDVVTGERTEDQNLNITVRADGIWEMEDGDGTHFIRSGMDSNPIGLLTVYGEVRFYDASSYDISIGGIDIKDGGTFRIQSGLGSSTYGPEFNPGTITIEAGGALYQNSTVDCWFDTTIVILNEGGQYQLAASTSVFPPTLVNNGKVRWQRNPSTVSTDQIVVDTNYYDVEFAFSGNNTKKVWTLYGDRLATDSLITSNTATLQLFSGDATPHHVTVGEVLRLTSGHIDNSATDANVRVANGAAVSRARGTIARAPEFEGVADVRYTSSLESVVTGPELPTASNVLRDLTIYCEGQTVSLGSDATVNGELTLSLGTFDNNGVDDDFVLTMADGATIRRAQGVVSAEAPEFAGTINVAYISTVAAVTTGLELPTGASVLNDLSITGNQGVNLGASVTVNGTLLVEDSNLVTGAFTVTLASGATLSEPNGFAVEGRVQTARTLAQGVNNDCGGIGIEINAAGAAPGATTILRVTGAPQSIDGHPGIGRYFDITPTVNTGLNATLVFHYVDRELGAIDEASLALYSSTDGGATWTKRDGTVDVNANTVTLSGIAAFSRWTLGAPSTGCCVGRVGDANASGDDEPTLGDISAIIAALFIQGIPDPIDECFAEADVNQSGVLAPTYDDITLGDISILISYLFIKGPYDPVTNPSGEILPNCL